MCTVMKKLEHHAMIWMGEQVALAANASAPSTVHLGVSPTCSGIAYCAHNLRYVISFSYTKTMDYTILHYNKFLH